MTAIGDGLALANDLLARQTNGVERRNQVVVLFTDVPVHEWFALPALVCLALASLLRAIPFVVDHTESAVIPRSRSSPPV